MMAREAGSPWANGNNRLTLSVLSSSLIRGSPGGELPQDGRRGKII